MGGALNTDQENFANVEWNQSHGGLSSPQSEDGRPAGTRKDSNTEYQAGRNADEMDLAGVGLATLECTVTQPIKENDGTKDAYISYLVTTHVSRPPLGIKSMLICIVQFPLLLQTRYNGPETIYRFSLSL
jgi:hypothetical protein